jgi:DNA polymerase (family 10)
MSGQGTKGTTGTKATGQAPRLARVEAAKVGLQVLNRIAPFCSRMKVAGSLRRGRETVGDVDLVVIPVPGGALRIGQVMREMHVPGEAADFRAGEKMVSALVRSPHGLTRTGTDGHGQPGPEATACQVDIYMGTEENFGMLFLVRTGSMEHNIWMAQWAKSAGMKFAAGTGIERDGKVIAGKTEEDVFKALGLAFVKPEEREIRGGRPVWQR